MYWRLDPFFSMDKIKGRHNVTIVFTDIVWRIYTVTGAKLARPQSMFITYNNDCCWFLRANDSWWPLLVIPDFSLSGRMKRCRYAKERTPMWENVAMIWEGRTKSFSPLACCCQKGHGSMFPIHVTICLASILFYLCVYISSSASAFCTEPRSG